MGVDPIVRVPDLDSLALESEGKSLRLTKIQSSVQSLTDP
jgi:hypothetical protein